MIVSWACLTLSDGRKAGREKKMEDFLKFFNEQISHGYYMHLEIGYNKIADYGIRVYRKALALKAKMSKWYGYRILI